MTTLSGNKQAPISSLIHLKLIGKFSSLSSIRLPIRVRVITHGIGIGSNSALNRALTKNCCWLCLTPALCQCSLLLASLTVLMGSSHFVLFPLFVVSFDCMVLAVL